MRTRVICIKGYTSFSEVAWYPHCYMLMSERGTRHPRGFELSVLTNILELTITDRGNFHGSKKTFRSNQLLDFGNWEIGFSMLGPRKQRAKAPKSSLSRRHKDQTCVVRAAKSSCLSCVLCSNQFHEILTVARISRWTCYLADGCSLQSILGFCKVMDGNSLRTSSASHACFQTRKRGKLKCWSDIGFDWLLF